MNYKYVLFVSSMNCKYVDLLNKMIEEKVFCFCCHIFIQTVLTTNIQVFDIITQPLTSKELKIKQTFISKLRINKNIYFKRKN